MRYSSRAGLGMDVRSDAKKIPTEGFLAYEFDQYALRSRRPAQTFARWCRTCTTSLADATLLRARRQRRLRGNFAIDPAQYHRARSSDPAHRSPLTPLTIS